jgi:hypothetical protein
MTDRELMQQTLDALNSDNPDIQLRTAIALRDRLAQPEQEPVAWGVFEGNLHDMFFSQEQAQEMADLKGTHAEVRPLYTTPQRTWVGLTEEEIEPEAEQSDNYAAFHHGVRFAQDKLKEKNT